MPIAMYALFLSTIRPDSASISILHSSLKSHRVTFAKPFYAWKGRGLKPRRSDVDDTYRRLAKS
jgi:hypothetical protein